MTTWQGTQREYLDLTRALNHNCNCDSGYMVRPHTACSTHRMLAEDQRALNGLSFGRRIAARLQDEEWLVGHPTRATRAGS
jgi:hypothetical protein